uniref:VWFD domain-containing protein n=1 Tax=Scleropages formosus TaxID=113540 RepID=A0A8C9WCB1_SCLFO
FVHVLCGITQPLTGEKFYVRSDCPFNFITFTHDKVDVIVTLTRGKSGLISRAVINVNNAKISLENGHIIVEDQSVSVPYNDMYRHIFQYGIYTKMKSKVLPAAFSILWQSFGNEISLFWVRGHGTHFKTRFLYSNVAEPTCPGNLIFQEFGPAFSPICSSSQSDVANSENITTCLCPPGTVLNDLEPGNLCVAPQNCPCVHNGQVLPHGAVLDERCQTCKCQGRDWTCEKKTCPAICTIEGRYVTTFDGKYYTLPGMCKYHAVVGLQKQKYRIFKSEYTVCNRIISFFASFPPENVTVFWQSSMFVQLHASTGMSLQVRVSPTVQLYLTLPAQEKGQTKGICGNYNDITTDEFISFTSYPESSSEVFAQSWAEPGCTPGQKCTISQTPGNAPLTLYHDSACEQSQCGCSGNKEECLCVVLANYAQACAKQGETVEGWRTVIDSTECDHNQKFEYNMQACNRTCRSLSEPDPTCEGVSDPVEGCGCPEGTYLSENSKCVPRIECSCYYGGKVFSGSEPVEVNGQKCMKCRKCTFTVFYRFLACPLPKTYKHCSGLQRTCDALTKPMDKLCQSGCFCPTGLYEDHYGNCVPRESCSCVSGEEKYRSGDVVEDNCKTCTCKGGKWNCLSQECPGKCQVYGNGHYKTFDSKWYHFDGHCQYTLVEDSCGRSSGSFSITAESVPCCDAALTCARVIVINLKGEVTLTLEDMNVKENLLQPQSSENVVLYSVHTFVLYIEISIPSMGLTVIWDKNTRLTIIADEMLKVGNSQKVCGLCGNFDDDETNDLQTRSLVQVTNALEFGNSWKTTTPPCLDAVNETFPCERFSYCAAWAEHRCKALIMDTFTECHQKVDPQYYLEACVKETCSCQFEGKFLGFCTAVAAYADACSRKGTCVKWRTPDLCPVYCDYYNEKDECTWHYRACGPSPELLTCGKPFKFSESLEGCYPQCPPDKPYFDENTRKCMTTETTSTTSSTTTETTSTITPSTTSETTPTISTSTTTETTSTTSSTTETTPTITPSTTTEITPTISTSTTTETTSTTTSSTTETTPTITPSTTTETTPTFSTSTTTETTPTISTSTTTETTSTPSSTTETTPTITTSTTETTPTITPSTTTETTSTTSSTTETTPTITPSTTTETTPTITPSTTTETTPTITTSTTETTPITTSSTTEMTPTITSQCDVYGDSHYITFQGTPYNFFESCTYILMKEKKPQYNFLVAVDNSNYSPVLLESLVKRVIVTYDESNVVCEISCKLSGTSVIPPTEKQGIRFQTTGTQVIMYMDKIRSSVTVTSERGVIVNVAMEHFANNTEGQCGVCAGGSCVRKGGALENDNCCPQTASSWVYNDPTKPHCQPREAPCTQPTPKPQCNVTGTICDILKHKTDKCLSNSTTEKGLCSSLSQAAEVCRAANVCVEWRHLTNGNCGNKSCFPFPSELKHLDSGTESRDSVTPGETWESKCNICTCNNITMTEECTPKPKLAPPTCKDNEMLITFNSTDSCPMAICVTYESVSFQVGDQWKGNNPCVSYSCQLDGIQIKERVCPPLTCAQVPFFTVPCFTLQLRGTNPLLWRVFFFLCTCPLTLRLFLCRHSGSGTTSTAVTSSLVHIRQQLCYTRYTQTNNCFAI